MLRSLCLLLLSTVTPAGNASAMAGITSDKPRIPSASLLPVTWYNRQPSNTGVIRRPAINNIRARMNQVNSWLIIMCCFFNIKIILLTNILLKEYYLRQCKIVLPFVIFSFQSLVNQLQVFFISKKICIACINKYCFYIMVFDIICIGLLYTE